MFDARGATRKHYFGRMRDISVPIENGHFNVWHREPGSIFYDDARCITAQNGSKRSREKGLCSSSHRHVRSEHRNGQRKVRWLDQLQHRHPKIVWVLDIRNSLPDLPPLLPQFAVETGLHLSVCVQKTFRNPTLPVWVSL